MSERQFCPNCGAPAKEDQFFCGKCGFQTQAAPGAVPRPPAAPYAGQAPSYARKKRGGTALIVLAIVCFLLAAGCVTAVLLWGPADVSPKELNGEWVLKVKPVTLINSKTDYFKKSDIGKETTAPVTLSLGKDGTGTMTIEQAGIAAAAYKSGKFAAEIMDGNMKLRFDGLVRKDRDGVYMEGSFVCTITKGTDKGDIARGTWKATADTDGTQSDAVSSADNEDEPEISNDATQSAEKSAEKTEPAPSQEPSPAALTPKDVEGIWVGNMVMQEIPGLDSIPGLTDEERKEIRESKGSEKETAFVFKQGMLWIGGTEKMDNPVQQETAAAVFGPDGFSADVPTSLGLAHIKGTLVTEGGTQKIKGTIDFDALPYSDTVKLPVKATFYAQKSPVE